MAGDICFGAAELRSLEGLPHLSIVIYLTLRRTMSPESGLVTVHLRELADECYVEPRQGFAGLAVSVDQVRRALRWLERALLVRSLTKPRSALVLELRLATRETAVRKKPAAVSAQRPPHRELPLFSLVEGVASTEARRSFEPKPACTLKTEEEEGAAGLQDKTNLRFPRRLTDEQREAIATLLHRNPRAPGHPRRAQRADAPQDHREPRRLCAADHRLGGRSGMARRLRAPKSERGASAQPAPPLPRRRRTRRRSRASAAASTSSRRAPSSSHAPRGSPCAARRVQSAAAAQAHRARAQGHPHGRGAPRAAARARHPQLDRRGATAPSAGRLGAPVRRPPRLLPPAPRGAPGLDPRRLHRAARHPRPAQARRAADRPRGRTPGLALAPDQDAFIANAPSATARSPAA